MAGWGTRLYNINRSRWRTARKISRIDGELDKKRAQLAADKPEPSAGVERVVLRDRLLEQKRTLEEILRSPELGWSGPGWHLRLAAIDVTDLGARGEVGMLLQNVRERIEALRGRRAGAPRAVDAVIDDSALLFTKALPSIFAIETQLTALIALQEAYAALAR